MAEHPGNPARARGERRQEEQSLQGPQPHYALEAGPGSKQISPSQNKSKEEKEEKEAKHQLKLREFFSTEIRGQYPPPAIILEKGQHRHPGLL